jgi:hypothetical protein
MIVLQISMNLGSLKFWKRLNSETAESGQGRLPIGHGSPARSPAQLRLRPTGSAHGHGAA